MNLLERLLPPRHLDRHEHERLARHDDTVAALTAAIAGLKSERDDLVDLCRERNERAASYAAALRRSEARRAELADRVRVLEAEAGECTPARPEMCGSLAECTGNRAAASRVTRVVAVEDGSGAVDRVLEAS